MIPEGIDGPERVASRMLTALQAPIDVDGVAITVRARASAARSATRAASLRASVMAAAMIPSAWISAAVRAAAREAAAAAMPALWPNSTMARPPPVEFDLNVSDVQGNARRTAVDNAPDSGPVTLAKGGDAKEMSESVMRHDEPGGS